MIITIPARKPNFKRKTCYLMHISVSADHKVKIKESEKINKYLDLVGELNNTNCGT